MAGRLLDTPSGNIDQYFEYLRGLFDPETVDTFEEVDDPTMAGNAPESANNVEDEAHMPLPGTSASGEVEDDPNMTATAAENTNYSEDKPDMDGMDVFEDSVSCGLLCAGGENSNQDHSNAEVNDSPEIEVVIDLESGNELCYAVMDEQARWLSRKL